MRPPRVRITVGSLLFTVAVVAVRDHGTRTCSGSGGPPSATDNWWADPGEAHDGFDGPCGRGDLQRP
jgi:hypothetical protein